VFAPDRELLVTSSYSAAALSASLDQRFGVARGGTSSTSAAATSTRLEQQLHLWNPVSGARLAEMDIEDIASKLVFSPDGRLLAGVGYGIEKGTQLIDLEERKVVAHLNGRVRATFSADGSTLANSLDNQVALWDIRTRQLRQTIPIHKAILEALAFSPDGATLAIAFHDGTVRLWDVQTNTQFVVLEGNGQPIEAVAFSPDGRSLATAGWDSIVRIWNPRTGQLRATLSGHDAPVVAIAFSPDSRTLISGGNDMSVFVWRADSIAKAAPQAAGSPETQKSPSSAFGRILKLLGTSRKSEQESGASDNRNAVEELPDQTIRNN
jgi:WD40 repeat protein